MIIPALYKRQKERGGFLTEQDQRAVADELGISLHRVQAVVSFFPHFRLTPPPPVQVQICRDMSCHLRGSTRITEGLQAWVAKEQLHGVEVCSVSCLGRCDRAPAAMINENLHVGRTQSELQAIVASYVKKEPLAADTDQSLAATKIGQWEMDPYAEDRDYSAVRGYAEELKPQALLDALDLVDTVLNRRGERDRAVAWNRPRRRGPDDNAHAIGAVAKPLAGHRLKTGNRKLHPDRRARFLLILDFRFRERGAFNRTPHHRLRAAINQPRPHDAQKLGRDRGFGFKAHRRVVAIPISFDAEALELFAL